MYWRIIILFVAALFLFGCSQDDTRVIQVDDDISDLEDVEDDASDAVSEEDQAEQDPVPEEHTDETETEGVETKADLAVTNFFLSTLYPEPNEMFEVNFKIKNRGIESIEDFDYTIKIMKGTDVKKIEYGIYQEELDSGETSDRISEVFSVEAGDYDVVITLDPSNDFIEDDEDNNVDEMSIAVQNPGTSSGSDVYTNPGTPSDDSSDDDDQQTASSTCVDTDNGKVYDEKGTCIDDFGNNVDDVCLDINEVWEWYCKDNRCRPESHTCYCENGICID